MVTAWFNRALQRIEYWLGRNAPPDISPIVLDRRRIYVLPSRAGLVFLLALGVMLLTSLNYNLNLGFAVVFILATGAFASIFHAFRNLLGLSIVTGRIEPVFAGEEATFHLAVENTRHTLRPALLFESRDGKCLLHIAGGSTGDVMLPRNTDRRGWLPLGRVSVETRYPLGLIRAWSVLRPESACLVYPAPEKHPPPLPESEAGNRGGQSGRIGDEEYAGLRNAQPADSPRHIAWKIVARDGPLMTKQFSGSGGGELLLDWDEALPDSPDVEARLSRLTAWVLAADAAGQRYRLNLPNIQIPAGTGPTHMHACLRQLALYGAKQDG